MDLGQLLVREGRTEIRVAGAYDLECFLASLTRKPPVARSAAVLRSQPAWAVLRVGPLQATNPAGRQTQHPRCLTLRQPLVDHTLDHARAIQLLVAHRHCLHDDGDTAAQWRKRTFLLCGNRTFLNCYYRRPADK